jgi:hypothetical protein
VLLIRHNASRVTRALRQSETATRSALRRTINRTIRSVTTLTLRRLSAETGLTQKRLKEYVTETKAMAGDLSASVRVRPHTFNIASFAGRQVKGVKPKFIFTQGGKRKVTTGSRRTGGGVSSNAWGKRKTYPHTFLIQGGKTAMVRVTKKRYPIRPVYGPRIHAEFVKLDDELKLEVQARFNATLRHELAFALGRVGLQAT